jgi:hypothetical protein
MEERRMTIPPAPGEPLLIGLKEELPETVQKEFDDISEHEEDVHIVVSSDMSLDGTFEDCWLLATDKLIILDKGEISEIGTHNELLANNGLYKHLVNLQSELSEIRAV